MRARLERWSLALLVAALLVPTAAQAAPCTVTITTTTLPSAQVGTVYNASISITGGTAPFTWDLSVGTLPPGLTLAASTSVISGTPTTAGTYPFTIRVTDSHTPAACTATQALTITVFPAGGLPDAGPGSIDAGGGGRPDAATVNYGESGIGCRVGRGDAHLPLASLALLFGVVLLRARRRRPRR